MVNNDVNSVKFIGRRDMNMDANLKALFDEDDHSKYNERVGSKYYPYFNDAKELFRI